MTNDCLVTKLKGAVNNESLPKLGVLRLQSINSPSKGQFTATKASKALYLKASANIFNSGQSNEFTANNVVGANGQNIQYAASETPYTLEISDKYTLKSLSIPSTFNSFSLSEFEACSILEDLAISGSGNPNINVNSIGMMKSITTFTIGRTPLKGTIEELVEIFVHKYPNSTKNLKITLYLCSGSGVTFNSQYYAREEAAMIAFSSGTAIVYAEEAMTTVLGSYDGTAWTYNQST